MPPFIIDMNNLKILPKNEISKIKQNLNIDKNMFVTLTGCSTRKLNNQYYSLIKKMLKENKNITHILVTDPKKHNLIRKKIGEKSRLILLDFCPNFDEYIQLADIYIDSFPQGSALTLVDCIKYKKPVIVRANLKEPIRSFEEYLYPNYPYTCTTNKEMLAKINKIANDKKEYEEISKKVYEHCVKTYAKEYSLPQLETFFK